MIWFIVWLAFEIVMLDIILYSLATAKSDVEIWGEEVD